MVSMSQAKRRHDIWIKDWIAPVVVVALVLFVITSCLVFTVVDQVNTGHESPLLLAHSHNDQSLRRSMRQDNQDIRPLTLSSKAEHPNSESLRYAFDIAHTVDMERITETVQGMRLEKDPKTVDVNNMTYDIMKCPPQPPEGYPQAWDVVEVLKHWNPDDTDIPSDGIYQGVCYLDWNDPEQRTTAETYRQAELPFLMRNHPELWQAAERWASPKYLTKLLGFDKFRNEYSSNNHFMYWKTKHSSILPHGWKPPTENVKLSFTKWYEKAKALEQATTKTTTDKEHWYFRLNAEFKGKADFMYDELPIFSPESASFFMIEPTQQRGINCRFGMKGVISEAHYDFSRNFIILLHGQKRYILAHPQECSNLELHPLGHPSARHSSVDWSNPSEWQKGNFPKAKVSEIILQAGDALYLPTAWFHFIVSLNLNYQCNARSGITHENEHHLKSCGFQ
jgi:hypothetical protein